MVRSSGGPHGYGAPNLGQAVVEAVAEAEGVDPAMIDRPLGEVIDVDALNALFAGREGVTGHIGFTYSGYDVCVRSDGRVTVEPVVGSA